MKQYNILDQYEDYVAGPFNEEQVEEYLEEHKEEGPYLIEIITQEEQ